MGVRVKLSDLSPEMRAILEADDQAARKPRSKRAKPQTPTAHLGLRLALESMGLPAPVVEYRFHPTRRWRFDYAWPAQLVALEIEGSMFGRGDPCPECGQRDRNQGHSSAAGIRRDLEKYNAAGALGWIVLRALPEWLDSGQAATVVSLALQRAKMA